MLAALGGCDAAPPSEPAGGIGTRVFVVQREEGALAVYDLQSRTLLPERVEELGNMRHAVMAFSPDLEHAFVATRSGLLTRIDLQTLERDASIVTSDNSIDIAISQDGRFVATAEYHPGGISILDAESLERVAFFPGDFTAPDGAARTSRATGIVDAPGDRFVAVLIEAAEVLIIDASGDEPTIEHRFPAVARDPYDAMITPDGRYYVVGHMENDLLTLVDLEHPEQGARALRLVDEALAAQADVPIKLPHMASWAFARGRVYVPMVGLPALAVVNPETWEVEGTIELRGNPVYAVRSPVEREIWVSFSGEEDDAWVQIVDTATNTVVDEIEVGARIYHMDFTPRGSHVLVSANGANALYLVDARTRAILDEEPIQSPSGVFGAWRAFRLGL
jgi:protein NirF